MEGNIIVERHPWAPYIPVGAKILILGTFPPGRHRWTMDFYYPNRINDFWRIMGVIFHNDKNYLYDKANDCFKLNEIKQLLNSKKIALSDTAKEIRRLRGNASDKFLEIVTPLPLIALLENMPDCCAVASTGEKAASVIAQLTNTNIPDIGMAVDFAMTSTRNIKIYRMPSTSRAYPLALDKKAEYYKSMFKEVGIID